MVNACSMSRSRRRGACRLRFLSVAISRQARSVIRRPHRRGACGAFERVDRTWVREISGRNILCTRIIQVGGDSTGWAAPPRRFGFSAPQGSRVVYGGEPSALTDLSEPSPGKIAERDPEQDASSDPDPQRIGRAPFGPHAPFGRTPFGGNHAKFRAGHVHPPRSTWGSNSCATFLSFEIHRTFPGFTQIGGRPM